MLPRQAAECGATLRVAIHDAERRATMRPHRRGWVGFFFAADDSSEASRSAFLAR